MPGAPPVPLVPAVPAPPVPLAPAVPIVPPVLVVPPAPVVPPVATLPPVPEVELATQVPLSQCWADPQTFPQAPQLKPSLPVVMTHDEPQRVCPAEQLDVQALLLHT